MKKTSSICALAFALLVCEAAAQQQVYKSIAADGKVTYSSTPPPEGTAEVVERVALPPSPSAAQQEEAEERMRQIEKETARSSQQRAKASEERAAAIAAAQQELERAQLALEETSIKTDSDWQPIAAGGRVLKQSYLDRVARAEEKVKAAESALKKARRGR